MCRKSLYCIYYYIYLFICSWECSDIGEYAPSQNRFLFTCRGAQKIGVKSVLARSK